MHLVPSTEAKAQLAELLRAVERGESFCITRHGKPIAHLLPATSGDRDARRDAIDRFRAQQKTWEPASMSAQDIQDARHEGHRA
mgnify:CR=1 FL=1